METLSNGAVEFCIYNFIYYYTTHLLQVGCYLQEAICIDAQTALYTWQSCPLNDFNYKRIYQYRRLSTPIDLPFLN